MASHEKSVKVTGEVGISLAVGKAVSNTRPFWTLLTPQEPSPMSWPTLRKLFARLLASSSCKPGRRRRARPPRLEALEERTVPATFMVLSTLDGGADSLRQAILNSNASSDPRNTIQFALTGSGVHTINLLSALPVVTHPVLIDGYSQAGSSANTRDVGDDAVLTIELNGASAGANANGLIISAANTTVRGLVINRFGHAGIELSGPSATNDIVAGNFIGTNTLGTAALRNGQGGGTGGVLVINGANNDIVGGENAADRNLISGNNGEGVMLLKQDGADTHDNTVENNYIGTNASGTAALGNLSSGIFVPFSGGNKIEGNLVSGNAGFAGIALGGIQPGGGFFRLGGFVSSVGDGASNIVSANLVGTDATATAALANLGYGISVDGGNQMTIGGTGHGAGNVISGNAREGIHFFDNARNMLILGNRIGTDGSGVAALGNQSDGISITGGATAVTVGGAGGRNLISGNAGNGISITTGATGNLIQGNDIGIDATGTRALGNGQSGVSVSAAGNTIGGTTATARNVLSGNRGYGITISGAGNLVEGNYIGTDVTGSTALGNGGVGTGGVFIGGPNNTIGGTDPGTGNLISGNSFFGILVNTSSGNVIQGNRIGTDASGTHALGNGGIGIFLGGVVNNTIGGTSAGAGNLISANQIDGIGITGNGNLVEGNLIGTDVTGNTPLGNGRFGVFIEAASANTVGGTAGGAGNLISANGDSGIEITGFGGNNVVQGNRIGTNAAGTASLGNIRDGMEILGSSNNTIGGTDNGAGNLISGNHLDGVFLGAAPNGAAANNNVLQGNRIGTDVTGTLALRNGGFIVGMGSGVNIDGSSNTMIGGTAPGAGNLISGNQYYGIQIASVAASGNQVQGNTIGTDVTGAHALGNYFGVYILSDAHNNTIGGTDPGAGNLISGNRFYGVFVSGANATGNVVQGNRVGTDASGTTAVGNISGVTIAAPNNIVGGTTATARNIISGNLSEGVNVSSTSGNVVQGNYVGTDITGTRAIPNGTNGNGDGVIVSPGATNTTVAGNVMSGNHRYGLYLGLFSSGTTAQGNFIGTDAAGTAALGNGLDGIYVAGATDNLIGGTAPGAGNVISGNHGYGIDINGSPATGNVVQGNYVGVDVTGTRALGNTSIGVGVALGSGNTVGGTAPGAGNVISGNGGAGIVVSANSAVIQGNYIGTDASGSSAIGNAAGVQINGTNNTIGGTAAGAGNVISGNRGDGIDVATSGTVIQGNDIGTDATGTVALPNANGVSITAANVTVGGPGAGNLISGNHGAGVLVQATGAVIQGNLIGTDVSGTHPLNNNTGVDVEGAAATNALIGGTTADSRNLISGGNGSGVLFLNGGNGVIEGNYIGTDISGAVALGNGAGVLIQNTSGVTVGETATGAGNLISGNGNGILLAGNATGNLIQGNLIGTDANGTHALGNLLGVVFSGGGSNTIGGTSAAARNVISGNQNSGIDLAGSNGNLIQGNYIGTDVTGTVALGNQAGVTVAGNNNTIGGSDPGAGNLISGNRVDGIDVAGTGNVIQGNLIGTDVTGTQAVANGTTGVSLNGASNTLVGGLSGTQGNVISGQADGVDIVNGGSNQIEGNLIGTDASGTLALGNIRGLFVRSSGNSIVGNVISGNRNNGLELDLPGGSNNVVRGNFIGTDVTGSVALPNSGVGIAIQTTGNLIGGTAPGQGNVISGNVVGVEIFLGSGNTIQGNYIGTDVTGTSAVPNLMGILVGAGANTIGGTAAGAGNLISGNTQTGLLLFSGGNQVQGNLIGTDATGAFALGNDLGVTVSSANNTIGGTTAGARNVVSGNHTAGILVLGAGAVIQGNYIGTDITGASAVGNAIGVSVSGSNNTLGGTAVGAGNLVSGNLGDGIFFSAGNNNLVQGNLIGTDATGTAALANGGNGVNVTGGAHDNTIGGTAPRAGNVIAFNSGDGVRIDTGTGNAILRNRIFANAGLGIELVNHGNNDQPAPVLTSAVSGGGFTTIQGTFTARASTTYLLEFFADSDSQGRQFLGAISVTTDATGHANIALTIGLELDPGLNLTATATDPANNTSAFSAAVGVTG
jgi:hypothetical protein